MRNSQIDLILAFAEGRLDEEEASRVKGLLETDSQAAELLAAYRMAAEAARLDDSSPVPADVVARAKAIFEPALLPRRPGLLERLERIVAHVVFDSRVQPTLVGLRGRGEAFQLSFEAGGLEIDLETSPAERKTIDGDGTELWRVVGQVMLDDANRGQACTVAMTDLANGTVVAESQCDDRGAFVLQATSGRFDLDVTIGNRTVVLEGIEIP